MATVHVERDFAVPVETLFDHLSEHENLATIFAPARIERLRHGDTERNGVGSIRKLSFAGILPFEETVTAVAENERIEYRITKGAPLRHGLSSVIAATLGSTIKRGLNRVDEKL